MVITLPPMQMTTRPASETLLYCSDDPHTVDHANRHELPLETFKNIPHSPLEYRFPTELHNLFWKLQLREDFEEIKERADRGLWHWNERPHQHAELARRRRRSARPGRHRLKLYGNETGGVLI